MKAPIYHLNEHACDTARESRRPSLKSGHSKHNNDHKLQRTRKQDIIPKGKPQQCTNSSSSAKSPQPATTKSSTSSRASQAPNPSPTKTRPLFLHNYAFQRSTSVPKGSQHPELPNHKNGSTNSHGQCKSLPARLKVTASGDSASSKRQIPA